MANFWDNIHRNKAVLGKINIEQDSNTVIPKKITPMNYLNKTRDTFSKKNIALVESNSEILNDQTEKIYTDDTPIPMPYAANTRSVYAGEMVCVITGQKHLALTDFSVEGPIRIDWVRFYSSANQEISNIGYGWRHSFSDQICTVGDQLIYTDERGNVTQIPDVVIGETVNVISVNLCIQRYNSDVIRLWSTTNAVTITRQFTRTVSTSSNYSLSYISDSVGNYWECEYEEGVLVGLLSSWGVGLKISYKNNKDHVYLIDDIKRYVLDELNKKAHNVKSLTNYRYDIHANQIAAIDAAGYQEKYSYQDRLLTHRFLKTGYGFTFEWMRTGEQNKCVRCYGEPINGQPQKNYHFSYDQKKRRTTVVDARSGIRQYFYNLRYQLIKQLNPEGRAIQITYDARGNLAEIINALMQRTRFSYDAQNRLVSIEDPLKQKQEFYFNEEGHLAKITDNARHNVTFEYNKEGLLASVTDPLGQTLYYQYNLLGLPISITDDDGEGITNQWDQYGRLITQQQLDDKPIHICYTDYDQIEQLEKENEIIQHFTYDAIGRVSQITDAQGRRASYQYNPIGLVTEHTGFDGKTVQYEYLGNNQLSKRINAAGLVLQYHYDGNGNQVSLINEAGEWYQFEYDLNNNLIEEIGFDGRIKRYEYNVVDQLVASHECKKPEVGSVAIITETTTFERDALGRIVEQRGQDGHSQYYSYNKEGKLTLAVNQHATVGFSYDVLGRLTSEIQDDVVIQHEYDNHNRKIVTRMPDKHVLRYEYGDGDVQTWLNEKCISHSYYDNLGQEIKRECEGFNNEYQYDSLGRLTQQCSSINESKKLIQRDYQYDAKSGLLDTIVDNKRGKTHYTYDAVEQLLAVKNRHPEQFSYDPTGNLVGVNAQHSVSPITGNRLETFGEREFSYNSKGNLVKERVGKTDKFETQYYYNDLNQLISFSRGGQEQTAVTYEYDALGRRIKKIDEQDTTRFFWNGNQLLSEQRGKNKTLYLFEQDSFRPLAMVQNDTVYYIQTDYLGTPQELLTENGELVWAAYYTAFGEVNQEFSSGVRCPLRFQGQYYDDETGLHYNRHRYYDPEAGRFISQDPIGLLGGLNNYRYVPNPVGWVDPLGLNSTEPDEGSSFFHQGPQNIPLGGGVYSETDLFHHVQVVDTGNVFGNFGLGMVYSANNIVAQLGNGAIGIVSLPSIAYAEANGMSVAEAENELLGLSMSTGGPIIGGGSGLLLTGGSRVARALKTVGKKVKSWFKKKKQKEDPPEGVKVTEVPDNSVFRETGARRVLDPVSLDAWDAVEGKYDLIRANTTDVGKIAENIGWSESRVARIKEHVFFKEHQLDSGLQRFDADPDMFNAWNRLETGDFVKSDIDLLRHEIFESKFEGVFKTNYRTAHDRTIDSGRTWTPE